MERKYIPPCTFPKDSTMYAQCKIIQDVRSLWRHSHGIHGSLRQAGIPEAECGERFPRPEALAGPAKADGIFDICPNGQSLSCKLCEMQHRDAHSICKSLQVYVICVHMYVYFYVCLYLCIGICVQMYHNVSIYSSMIHV